MLNKKSIPEQELLLLASKGCEASFAALFHLHKDNLYSYLLRLTKSEQQTLDFIQDIFMKLWINRENLSNIDNLNAYIFRSAQNQVINSFKRAMIETSMRAKLKVVTSGATTDVEDAFEYKILREKLESVVEKLPSQQRLVYRLSREQGLKHEAIAEQLQISSSTVKNHMVQALKTIKKFLREEVNIAGAAVIVVGNEILFL